MHELYGVIIVIERYDANQTNMKSKGLATYTIMQKVCLVFFGPDSRAQILFKNYVLRLNFIT